jgi:hypothetical protein
MVVILGENCILNFQNSSNDSDACSFGTGLYCTVPPQPFDSVIGSTSQHLNEEHGLISIIISMCMFVANSDCSFALYLSLRALQGRLNMLCHGMDHVHLQVKAATVTE